MIQELDDQTNAYAEAKIQEKENGDPLWTPTTVPEMRALFGIWILMGIHCLPREEMYWSADDESQSVIIKMCISSSKSLFCFFVFVNVIFLNKFACLIH